MSHLYNISPERRARMEQVFRRTEKQKAEERKRQEDEQRNKPENGIEQEKPIVSTENRVITPANIQNPGDYIILEGKIHGNYSYPDLLVSMDRKHYGKNWDDSHKALTDDGNFMLSIRQFVDFVKLLRTVNVYDGTGSLIGNNRKINGILDEIYKVGGDWRSEWLDAKFELSGDKIFINYEHRNQGGNIEPRRREQLVDYLSSNKCPGIDLENWLNNASEHGLPEQNVKNGSIYYWKPENERVAGFDAYSGRAYLDCGRDPSSSDSSLGVRLAREKI